MKTGFKGTFVIPWSQTEVDGVPAAPLGALAVGSVWRRMGKAMRVDGPADLLLLDGPEGEADTRRRAAHAVHRLVGAALDPGRSLTDMPDAPLMDRGFVVTDGLNSYTATEISTGDGRPPLLMFVDELPPAHAEMWVVREIAETPPVTRHAETPPGVICFAAGTLIDTPDGPRLVEDLAAGDRIQTKDDGVQEVLWTGRRRMSGARLYAMPYLRPVRIRTGALGIDRPDGDLIVSPQHRVLVTGPAAELLFRTSEVLVAAEDLINDRSIVHDRTLREVTYVHLMLERHQVVWANGVETESFHPANTALETVSPDQRGALLEQFPAIAHDPFAYGDFARRNLSASEAAILQHEGGLRH
ncbi:MAG: Hint domain-containing protein [Paracoccaceae bacterium]